MATQEPLLQYGYDNTTGQPPQRRTASPDYSRREEDRDLPAPQVIGDMATCLLAHRADGKVCGDRLSVIDARGVTDYAPVLDHLRSDAHRLELMSAIGYALRTARLHEPRKRGK